MSESQTESQPHSHTEPHQNVTSTSTNPITTIASL
ncbi:MAG: hypothetical protein JWP98_570, partial [Edaphobacter sp.]|nr:hypothetical protein [Edaphobacter sp.]